MAQQLEEQIFDPSIPFEERAVAVYQYQMRHCAPYRRYVESLYGQQYNPADLASIPLMPVEVFREVSVLSDEIEQPEVVFRSSGTSSMKRSHHHVAKVSLYERAIRVGFNRRYGIKNPVILAYTPGYNENPESSLIYMLNYLIAQDTTGKSHFLDVDDPPDQQHLGQLYEAQQRPILLFGAAFGLLDWIEKKQVSLPEDTIIMETGGMKTHRREMTKHQLRHQLAEGFAIKPEKIHSEYGMTEMLSQAYAYGDPWFYPADSLKVTIRDEADPDFEVDYGESGVIGIYDLANLYSCSFFQTSDTGVARDDGAFQVSGRATGGTLRGCNFLLEED